MAPGLTVVVTCADRKSLPVTQRLRYSSLPPGTSVERARDWHERLALASDKRPLSSLYQGEQWKASLRLCNVARQAGFEPSLVVASAGLGLQPVNTPAPAYAATFALGKPDSVGHSVEDAAAWWAQLGHCSSSLDLAALTNRVLLVLSRSYALPLADDLAALGATNPDAVMVGGASEIPGIARVPSDARLRRALGGTLSSLNQRMATRFLQVCDEPTDWCSEAHWRRWNSWSTRSQQSEGFNRRRGSDDAIKTWISATLDHQQISASRALRELRDQGYACEQSRFGQLYREVVREQ